MAMLMNPNKYFNVEQIDDDPDLRSFHSSMPLLSDPFSRVEGFKGVEFIMDQETGFKHPIPDIMKEILGYGGVVWCRVTKSAVVVRKSPLHTWDDIMAKILEMWKGIVAVIEIESYATLPDEREDVSWRDRQLPPKDIKE